MIVKFVKFNENARIPEKAHPSDFGYDVYAVSEEEIAPNVWRYGLGFGLQIHRGDEKIGNIEEGDWGSVDIPSGFNTAVLDMKTSSLSLDIDARPRSSVWKTGMSLANCEATIDENYTGEIKLVFYHLMPNMPRYKVGDKIAQIKLGAALPMEFVEVDKLDDTDRGEDSFGSSDGKQIQNI